MRMYALNPKTLNPTPQTLNQIHGLADPCILKPLARMPRCVGFAGFQLVIELLQLLLGLKHEEGLGLRVLGFTWGGTCDSGLGFGGAVLLHRYVSR